MIFVLIVIALFAAISIYFFFKAERLQREISLMKREVSTAKKENKNYMQMIATIAQRYEDTSKQRLAELKATEAVEAEIVNKITPLINNYAAIFNDSVRAKGKLQSSVKNIYEGYQQGSYKAFSNYIALSDKTIKRAWSSNNINGLIIMVEAFLQLKKS